MPQTLLLTVRSHVIEAGTNTTNPMGLRIRINANHDGSEQHLRLYFFDPDTSQPGYVGGRASDGALVLFLQRRDFSKYLLSLDQAGATNILVQLEDDDNITAFYMSTEPFVRRSLEESDFAEYRKRTAKSELH
tara:strand:- start:4379 stop:4777 length:399 start_codon:yes stop_codon:yes gene_type:complete